MTYRLIATEVGDLIKWVSSVNEIKRVAYALFRFNIEEFPNEAITSSRAQIVYDCILSLAKQKMTSEERNQLLFKFCRRITPDDLKDKLNQILQDNLGPTKGAEAEAHTEFSSRSFHSQIFKHCKRLYAQGNYFHAVFEACKVYNREVQLKSQSSKEGSPLMMEVWNPESGVLKITPCVSETDKNIQEGMKFLSTGLMRAVRNPTGHEPALFWPIKKEDCLDLLSFMSFLFRQLDKAVYFKNLNC